jgi:hypothetical protein
MKYIFKELYHKKFYLKKGSHGKKGKGVLLLSPKM